MKTNYFSFHRILLIGSLYTVLFIFADQDLNAQNAPAKQWDKTFGGSNTETPVGVLQTLDGGYIAAGTSLSGISGDKTQTVSGNNDYWVVKTDAAGNKIWDKTFGGSDSDYLYDIKLTTDGGFVLAGSSSSDSSSHKSQNSKGRFDFWLLKFDINGNKKWDKTYGGIWNERITSVQQTTDGGYILGGVSTSDVSGDKVSQSRGSADYWIVKTDSIGNLVWEKSFGSLYWDELISIQQTSDGGYIAGGFSNSYIRYDKSQSCRGEWDYWIIKMDASGTKLWDKTYGGNVSDQLYTLQQTIDGGFIAGGTSASGISGDKSTIGFGAEDFWVLKLDAVGNKIWEKTYGGSNSDGLRSILQLPDSTFILGGYSNSGINSFKSEPGNGNEDFWFIKIDANGNQIWDKTIGGSNYDELISMQLTNDGGFILGGASNSPVTGDKSEASRGGLDMWIVKLGPEIVGINQTELNFNHSIFPNPSNGKFRLQLNNIATPKATVTITDLTGRKIMQTELSVTDRHISEELEIKAAKGIYLLQIYAGNQLITQKIVVE